MALDEAGDIGALWHDEMAVGAGVVEGGAHERLGHAATAEFGRNEGMREDETIASEGVFGDGEMIVDAGFVTVEGWVVFHSDRHGVRPSLLYCSCQRGAFCWGMARKPRIQFEGAIYHVMNRGNYRRDLFESAGAAQAFEQCLWEACEQAGWRLHAYTLMRNHYHLVVETPRANLVEGMHWLQSTFAVRFNRLRDERGHLFQSRYQAILVEPGPRLAHVVNYVHLNPVRAGIVELAQLRQFRWSSFRRFLQEDRPSQLMCAEWLRELGGLADTAEGWRSYQSYLAWLAADEGEQKRQAFDTLTRGWAVGSDAFRGEVAERESRALARHVIHGPEWRELREKNWAAALATLLTAAQKTTTDAAADWGNAPWKIAIAGELRRTTTATNAWIARELHMGAANSVSQYLSDVRAGRRKI